MINILKIFLIFIISLIIGACSSSTDYNKKRVEHIKNSDDNITLAVVWPFKTKISMFEQGIDLAVKEINSNGGILNKKIKIIKKDDNQDVTQGRIIAQKLIENLNISAVIGHFNSYVSIPCSSMYQFGGILMLTPSSTSPDLTKEQFNLIFRNIPNDNQFGRQIADYMKKQNLKKVMIYYIKDSYGLGLANAFESRSNDIGIEIIDRLSYDNPNDKIFKRVINKWKDYEYDAIFLAGSMPGAAMFIKQARILGVKVPIFGGDGLDSSELWEIAGKYSNGTVVASVFHHDDPRYEVQKFINKFKKEYNKIPDAWAAQGYDSVKLITDAITDAGTAIPYKITQSLRNFKNWNGVTGIHNFNSTGDVIGKSLVLKKVHNNQFEYLTKTTD